jgi:hypothetical protein
VVSGLALCFGPKWEACLQAFRLRLCVIGFQAVNLFQSATRWRMLDQTPRRYLGR